MKKNKLSVQNFIAVCITSIAVLAGCAGFTEDTSSSSCFDKLNDFEHEFSMAQVSSLWTASVDETERTLTLVDETNGGCFKKDSAFVWNDEFYRADSLKFFYSFLGDTLVLTDSSINHDTGLPTYTSLFFIGGTNGVLDDIWKMLPCVSFAGYPSCTEYGMTTFIQINKDKVEIRESDDSYDYMHSSFVYNLFVSIDRKSQFDYSMVDLKGLFARSLDLDYLIAQEGFVIDSKTNKNMRFTYGGESYTLNVVYASHSDSAIVSFSSENDSCVGHYRNIEFVSQELCREEFADYMYEIHLYREDKDLWGYKNNDFKEFGSCISRILGRKNK